MTHLSFKSTEECEMASGSDNEATPRPTLNPTSLPTKWYADYSEMDCVEDCTGALPCGGLSQSWQQKFDSHEDCCKSNKVLKSCEALHESDADLFT